MSSETEDMSERFGFIRMTFTLKNWIRKWYLLSAKNKIGGYFCFNKNKRQMEEKHLIANVLFQSELETLAD